MHQLRFVLGLIGLISLSTYSKLQAKTFSFAVSGTDDKHCQAYFHSMRPQPTNPVVLSFHGTGIYSTASEAYIEPALRRLYTLGRISVLTFDKPGIQPKTRKPGAAVVNDRLYNRYVQNDLVACAIQALLSPWIPTQAPILLSGHSEGAQIAVRILAHLSTTNHPLKSRIKALFLSSIPLNSWQEMLSRQLSPKNRSRFFTAFKRQDDKILRTFGQLSFHYLQAVFVQESLGQTFQQLRQQQLQCLFYIYQGLNDRHTPAEVLQTFVKEHEFLSQSPFRVQYYRAGHTLNRQAIRDISRDIAKTISSTTQTELACAARACPSRL